MLSVTFDVFSGRSNPTRVVNGARAQDLLRTIADNRAVVAEAGSNPVRLGYRGLIVELLDDDLGERFGLPADFCIANGASLNETRGLEIARELLDEMHEWTSRPLADEAVPKLGEPLQELLLQQLRVFGDRAYSSLPDRGADESEPADVTCYFETSKFNPDFWNSDSQVRRNNNCYNYARNKRTDTFAQPGRASGYHPTAVSCEQYTNAVLSDGAHKRYDCFPDSEKPRWLMALAVWPGVDYHWYRKHTKAEGFWGHKPGQTNARNIDNSGHLVSDPRTCDRGPYSDFCGYFYACKSMTIR